MAELLRMIATPTRLLLLCQIAQGESSVADLERDLGMRQPGLSQQLAELRRYELVKTRRESRSIHYSIADPRVRSLLDALHAIFCSEGAGRFALGVEPATPWTSPTASHAPDTQAARFARVIR
ncbi:transcriptional regulator [Xanthomonas oryzae pv. oryzae]|nr:ArsR family transcriptional regulator [Xanthomonas oryzae pv. oryzae]AUI91358.1 transcriptional regulator [Xanthomonas oryzae pv. oryzae]AUI95030.1 transcriptional regulator [Xanthomonas oryzae pv. oryzae]AUI98704.1 transcriptional regulator [Xanthomonas oryzae pv. oryzae]AUJ02382.1 transcriptional regulator [Xanthomonas oryzae pv. oryzae]